MTIAVFFMMVTICNACWSEEIPSDLFDQAVKASGEKYKDVRDRLLSAEGAENFLKEVVQGANQSAEKKWLARILLFQIQSPEDYEKLVTILQNKSANSIVSQDIRRELYFPTVFLEKRNVNIAAVLEHRMSGLLFRDDNELFPRLLKGVDIGDSKILPTPTLLELETNEGDPRMRAIWQNYLREKQLPPSDNWDLVAGEILMKGWLRTKEVKGDADYEESPDSPGGMRGGDRIISALKHWIYVRNAVSILGDLKEPKARVPIEQIVINEKNHRDLREAALIALGKIGDPRSIPILRKIVDRPTEWFRSSAVSAIAEIGGEDSIQELKKIEALGDKNDAASYRAKQELERRRAPLAR